MIRLNTHMQYDECEQQCVGRKQSASDLQSRLKTRKLLGVGELVGYNGDIYKSKISQLLGINESLYVRLPVGLVIWNTSVTMYIFITGAMCLVAPSLASGIEFAYETPPPDLFPIRMYGAVLTAYGLLFRCLLAHKDARSGLSTVLLSVSAVFALQLIVGVCSGRSNRMTFIVRMVFLIGTLVYQSLADAQGGVYRYFLRVVTDMKSSRGILSRASSNEESDKTS